MLKRKLSWHIFSKLAMPISFEKIMDLRQNLQNSQPN